MYYLYYANYLICAYIIKCALNYINNESEVILTLTIHETRH